MIKTVSIRQNHFMKILQRSNLQNGVNDNEIMAVGKCDVMKLLQRRVLETIRLLLV